MDTSSQGSGANNEQQGAQANTQSAGEDLKKVADRAKAAASGFDFHKLFNGRIDQTNYLYFAIGSVVLGYILMMIPLIGWIGSIALAVLGVGATVRRLNDIGQTGWLAALLIIPPIGLLLVIYLCWKHGVPSANAHGDVPDPKRDTFKAVLNT
jgi:uncharacterized membrane protein YhaH (DUF805 family)